MTAFGALTDPRGHYFINNLTAGPAALRAVLVVYRPAEVRDLRVLALGYDLPSPNQRRVQ